MTHVSVPALRAGLIGSMLALLGACATTPETVPELEQARAAIQELERQPNARAAAGQTLSQARTALERAETALEEGESLAIVTHEAYIARRQAEIGIQLASEAEAVDALEAAESRRNELRLQARTVEAERAERLAERRAQEAERNAREAALSRSVAEAAIEEADRLAGELEEMEAEQTERGVVLTLADVLFDTNAADLKAGAGRAMDRLAEYLTENPERQLLIEGHTDARGSDEYNRQLSAERANAVAEALAQRGVARDRLRTAGLGEAYPVATNDTPAGMQENRRVEIVLSDQDGEFPPAAENRLTSRR